MPKTVVPALLALLFTSLGGCTAGSAAGEPSAFFTEASLGSFIERDHPSLEPDGSFVITRNEAAYDVDGRTHHFATHSADLAVLSGREEALHRDLHAQLETILERYRLAITRRDGSGAGRRLILGYRGAQVAGWLSVEGVRTGERSYRIGVVITESPLATGQDPD